MGNVFHQTRLWIVLIGKTRDVTPRQHVILAVVANAFREQALARVQEVAVVQGREQGPARAPEPALEVLVHTDVCMSATPGKTFLFCTA